ncbi:MAG: galactose oxidase-like domain-containing protein [Actinomycetota bacterium]
MSRYGVRCGAKSLLAVVMAAAAVVAVPPVRSASAADPRAEEGAWSESIPWEFNAIHGYVDENGHVVTWGGGGLIEGSDANYHIAVWDPKADVRTYVRNDLGSNLFCSVSLSDSVGRRNLMLGGKSTSTRQNSFTAQFANGVLSDFDEMNDERWYATANTLADGRILVQGGTPHLDGKVQRYDEPKTAEVYQEGQGWTSLSGTFTDELWKGDKKRWFYPKSHVTPSGDVWAMAWNETYLIDPDGNGGLTRLGPFPNLNVGATSVSVQYDSGKVLQVGGGGFANNDRSRTGRKIASIVDLNSPTPTVTQTGKMTYGRHWADGVILPDGRVMVVGGSAVNNRLEGVAYHPEIWDPATGQWTVMAPNATPRLYHSMALLMSDGAVFTAGGGGPGPVTNKDAEIFYPPYLFNDDGSRAPQMTVSGAPDALVHGQSFSFGVDGAVDRVTMIKVNNVTHSVNAQIFQELTFDQSGNTVTASAPANANVATPGLYQLFALDAAGVPSEAAMVWIEPVGTQPPAEPGPELIADGGFEAISVGNGKAKYRDSADWDSTYSGGKLRVWDGNRKGVEPFEGRQYADLNGLRGATISQTLTVEPGATYEFTVQRRSRQGPSTLHVTVDGGVVFEGPAPTGTWTETTGTFTASSSTVVFGLRSTSGGGQLLVDAVSVRRTG